MTYTELVVVALLVVAVLDLAVLRTRLLCRKAFWMSYAILLFFQLLVNGLLAGLPIVSYNPDAIIGLKLVFAPVEDLLFGFCMILLTLSGWVWLGRLSVRRLVPGDPSAPPATRAPGAPRVQ
jgi:lycopene cyclase domain-containing protein